VQRRSLSIWVFSCMVTLAAASVVGQEWGYFGDVGPEHWGGLSPEFATCGTGEEQSPINFGHSRFRSFHRSLRLDYGPTEGEIFNNGHTIEVETHGENFIELDREKYQLVQFHFHSPSEHRLLGRGFDMELHLVHQSAAGRLAVVGLLLRRGNSSGGLSPIFEQLPDDVGVHHPLEEFDARDLLPRNLANYRYAGSLTTPPCS